MRKKWFVQGFVMVLVASLVLLVPKVQAVDEPDEVDPTPVPINANEIQPSVDASEVTSAAGPHGEYRDCLSSVARSACDGSPEQPSDCNRNCGPEPPRPSGDGLRNFLLGVGAATFIVGAIVSAPVIAIIGFVVVVVGILIDVIGFRPSGTADSQWINQVKNLKTMSHQRDPVTGAEPGVYKCPEGYTYEEDGISMSPPKGKKCKRIDKSPKQHMTQRDDATGALDQLAGGVGRAKDAIEAARTFETPPTKVTAIDADTTPSSQSNPASPHYAEAQAARSNENVKPVPEQKKSEAILSQKKTKPEDSTDFGQSKFGQSQRVFNKSGKQGLSNPSLGAGSFSTDSTSPGENKKQQSTHSKGIAVSGESGGAHSVSRSGGAGGVGYAGSSLASGEWEEGMGDSSSDIDESTTPTPTASTAVGLSDYFERLKSSSNLFEIVTERYRKVTVLEHLE